MFAIVEAYRAGLLKPKYYLSNISAGIIVGVVALPLAMAFAIASGAKPEQGLYTAIVAAIVVGIFGGTQVQIAGPTGAFIVILANITAHYGLSGLQIASFLAGFILLLMGLLRLGTIIKYIPEPVILGFTSGIGVIIFVNEWKDFFGLPLHISLEASFLQKLHVLILALPEAHGLTLCMAFFSLSLLLITPYLSKRIPGPLVAIVLATALQKIYTLSSIATLGSSFGGIPHQLPHFEWPTITQYHLLHLGSAAVSIALLGAVESLLSAAAADSMAGTHHNSNQELIGQGLANILCPLFGGFAATGAIARTATNIRQGGNSPIAAITHSMVLLLTIVLLAPLAAHVPLCTLAAILFVVAFNMSDLPRCMNLLKHATSHQCLLFWITFLLTLFANLVIAVIIGTTLASVASLFSREKSDKIAE